MRDLWRKTGLRLALAVFAAFASPFGLPTATVAQEGATVISPILTIDSETLFSDSAFGQRARVEFEAAGQRLEAENRRIETELQNEERQLTEDRPTMTPEAFRDLADAFDQKVQRLRAEQAAKLRALTLQRDLARRRFLEVAQPVLEGLMADAGAAIIVEKRAVFYSARAIDVTQAAITRLDAQIGDGSVPQQATQQTQDPASGDTAPDTAPDTASD